MDQISNGLNRFVRDLTGKSRTPGEVENDSGRTEQPSSQELTIVPYSQEGTEKPSAKAKTKPTASFLQPPVVEQIPIHERKWMDVEPTQEHSSLSYDISERMITLLRHGPTIFS